jgi:hypothetical protein
VPIDKVCQRCSLSPILKNTESALSYTRRVFRCEPVKRPRCQVSTKLLRSPLGRIMSWPRKRPPICTDSRTRRTRRRWNTYRELSKHHTEHRIEDGVQQGYSAGSASNSGSTWGPPRSSMFSAATASIIMLDTAQHRKQTCSSSTVRTLMADKLMGHCASRTRWFEVGPSYRLTTASSTTRDFLPRTVRRLARGKQSPATLHPGHTSPTPPFHAIKMRKVSKERSSRVYHAPHAATCLSCSPPPPNGVACEPMLKAISYTLPLTRTAIHVIVGPVIADQASFPSRLAAYQHCGSRAVGASFFLSLPPTFPTPSILLLVLLSSPFSATLFRAVGTLPY